MSHLFGETSIPKWKSCRNPPATNRIWAIWAWKGGGWRKKYKKINKQHIQVKGKGKSSEPPPPSKEYSLRFWHKKRGPKRDRIIIYNCNILRFFFLSLVNYKSFSITKLFYKLIFPFWRWNTIDAWDESLT